MSRRTWTGYMVAILCLPVLVIWHRDNALFTPPLFSDPWFYLGYFRTLIDFKRELFPDAYFGSRLSWILPGFLVHRIFSPLAANFVLHVGVHLVSSFSFFAILRRTVSPRAAFLSTLVFSLNPWLWAATGWDYVNGAGIAYLLCTMAALTIAAERAGAAKSLTAAGAGMAAMVYAHFLWLSFLPLLLLYYAGLAWTLSSKRVLAVILGSVPWLAAGFALVSAALGCVNYAVDGTFWFYRLSWRAAMRVPEVFTTAPGVWSAHALVPWLWLPAMIGALSIMLLPPRLRTEPLKAVLPALLFSAQFLLALAWMSYLQSRGIAMLGFYHYAAYLLPFAFLTSGALLWDAVGQMTDRTYVLTCCAAAAAFGVVWYEQPASSWPLPTWLTACLCALLLAAGAALRRRLVGTWLVLGAFVLLSAHDATETIEMHGTREAYRRIMETREKIERVRHHDAVRIWFDESERPSAEYYALSNVYLGMRLGIGFPHESCKVAVQPGTLIAVPSVRADAAELAQRELSNCWRAASIKAVVLSPNVGPGDGRPYAVALLRAITDLQSHRPLRVVTEADTLRLAADSAGQPFPLEFWKKESPAAQMHVSSAGLDVRTSNVDYEYAMAYPPLLAPVAGRYRFALRYTNNSGEFAFGAFPADNSRWIAVSTVGYRDGDAREIAFTVDCKAGEAIVLRVANNNNHKDGRPAAFRLLQVTATLADAQ